MNRRTLRRCLITGLIAAISASAYGGILFEENFRNYNQQARTINDAASYYVDNDPIWARSANLQVRVPEKSPAALVFANLPSLPKDNRFDFHFRYTHINATAAKGETPASPAAFDIILSTADGKKTQKIRIASDSVAGTTIDWRDNWQWQMFAIKANGKSADIFYTHDRSFRKLTTISLDATFDSVNVLASPNNFFAISDVVLSTPAALPSFPVEKHFASFESLKQPIPNAKKVNGTSSEIVSFNTDKDFGLRLSLGSTNKVSSVTVHWNGPDKNGKGSISEKGDIFVLPQSVHLFNPVGPNDKGKRISLQNSSIEFGRLFNQSVRPSMNMFCSSYSMVPQAVDIIREWDRLPTASSHPLDVDFIRTKSGSIQVYADGSLMTTLARDGASVTNISFEFGPGTTYAVKPATDLSIDRDRFTTFDFSAYPRAKAFAKATSSLKPGISSFSGIPINVAAPIDSADVAICKEGQGNWALECDEYHGRMPSHGFPSAIHYRIPAAFYGKAYLLFALDPDPKKDRILTIRLGHYNSHGTGGNMLGDTVLDFSDGQIPANCREVGSLKNNGKNIPIYLAEVSLNLGPILDVATGKSYDYVSNGNFMDFEFTGKGYENFEQIDNTMKPDPNSDSAFNLFGVTLEKLPVQIYFDQNKHPGNIYTSNEKNRKTFFDLVATRPNAKGKVSWSILDVSGKELSNGSRPYAISKIGATNRIEIALGDKLTPGYYTAKVVFDDAASKCEFTHDATFAILPPEKRKVNKLDSPYAVWWFSAHGSPGATEIGGPILQKAGIVRFSANSMTPENHTKYNTTNYRIHYTGGVSVNRETCQIMPRKIKETNPDDPNGRKIEKEYPGEEALYRELKQALEGDPLIDTIMMWHETGPGYGIPEELLGYPMPDNLDEQIKRDRNLAINVDTTARIIHKVAKELKRDIRFQLGNSSASIGSILRPLRAGAKVESYDQIGIETPSQVIPPERLSEVGLQGMIISREVGEYYAKKQNTKHIPALNGCWEFTYRTDRDMGEKQQAEWYMRDVLISLANNFYYISPGILFDCKNAYYNGLWGGSGLIRRGPFCYPKQAYVAYGVLTSVLDGVKFIRQIDTGSTTVYALEFKRVDGLIATALWTARGEATLRLDGANGATATFMLGESLKIGKDSLLTASTSPSYVVTKAPLKSVTIENRTFTEDEAISARAKVAAPLSDASQVSLSPDPEMETKHNGFLPILKPADFSIATITNDAAKGSCIEVTLDTSKNTSISHYITEYTTVRLAEPAPIPGNPSVIGVWVKGNSNWGQIRFEIEDANGEVFKNLTTGQSWGCDIMDWPGNLAVNFDGWNYVYTALRPTSLINDHSPGPLSDQWVSEGGNKKIDFPVKVRAITIGMNRQKLDLLDFKPTAPSIRLRDVGGAE